MLGDQGVTDSNIMQYLGIIEQRANEVLHLHAAAENGGVNAVQAILFASARRRSMPGGSGGRGSTPGSMSSAAALASGTDASKSQKLADYDSILGGGARTQHEHAPVHVEPPSIDAFDAEGEMASITGITSERPIPREELQRKTQELSEKKRHDQ